MTTDRAREIAAEIDDQNSRMTSLIVAFAIAIAAEVGILLAFLTRL